MPEVSTHCFNKCHPDHLPFLLQSQRTSTPTWMPPRPSWSKANRWQWTAQCKEWSWCFFPGISPTETWVGAEQNKCFCSPVLLWGFQSWAQMNPRCRDTPYFLNTAWFMAVHQSVQHIFGWFIGLLPMVKHADLSINVLLSSRSLSISLRPWSSLTQPSAPAWSFLMLRWPTVEPTSAMLMSAPRTRRSLPVSTSLFWVRKTHWSKTNGCWLDDYY